MHFFIYYYRFLGVTTADVVIQYLKKFSPVYTGVDWRINYVHEKLYSNMLNNESTSSASVRGYSVVLIILLTMITGLLT